MNNSEQHSPSRETVAQYFDSINLQDLLESLVLELGRKRPRNVFHHIAEWAEGRSVPLPLADDVETASTASTYSRQSFTPLEEPVISFPTTPSLPNRPKQVESSPSPAKPKKAESLHRRSPKEEAKGKKNPPNMVRSNSEESFHLTGDTNSQTSSFDIGEQSPEPAATLPAEEDNVPEVECNVLVFSLEASGKNLLGDKLFQTLVQQAPVAQTKQQRQHSRRVMEALLPTFPMKQSVRVAAADGPWDEARCSVLFLDLVRPSTSSASGSELLTEAQQHVLNLCDVALVVLDNEAARTQCGLHSFLQAARNEGVRLVILWTVGSTAQTRDTLDDWVYEQYPPEEGDKHRRRFQVRLAWSNEAPKTAAAVLDSLSRDELDNTLRVPLSSSYPSSAFTRAEEIDVLVSSTMVLQNNSVVRVHCLGRVFMAAVIHIELQDKPGKPIGTTPLDKPLYLSLVVQHPNGEDPVHLSEAHEPPVVLFVKHPKSGEFVPAASGSLVGVDASEGSDTKEQNDNKSQSPDNEFTIEDD